jgi:hypothetical protein
MGSDTANRCGSNRRPSCHRRTARGGSVKAPEDKPRDYGSMTPNQFEAEMKPDELTNYFARLGDNAPTEIAQAVNELPPEYSGVPQSRHDLLTRRALDAQFGHQILEITEIEQAIEAAESAVEAARDEVRLEVGIYDPAKFNELAASIEAKHSAPWLR